MMADWKDRRVTMMLREEWGLTEKEAEKVFRVLGPLIDDPRLQPWDAAMAVGGVGDARIDAGLSAKQKAFAVFWCGYVGGAAHSAEPEMVGSEMREALTKRYRALKSAREGP